MLMSGRKRSKSCQAGGRLTWRENVLQMNQNVLFFKSLNNQFFQCFLRSRLGSLEFSARVVVLSTGISRECCSMAFKTIRLNRVAFKDPRCCQFKTPHAFFFPREICLEMRRAVWLNTAQVQGEARTSAKRLSVQRRLRPLDHFPPTYR